MKKVKPFLTVLFLISLVPFTGSAQDGDPAILSRGPVPHAGIEFLGVNAISSQYGEYIYNGGVIRVYYTTETIFLSDKWVDAGCGNPDIKRLSGGADRTVLVYSDRRGWTAFLSFETGVPWACRFVEIYSSRQNYFLNISRNKKEFSFPAILEL